MWFRSFLPQNPWKSYTPFSLSDIPDEILFQLGGNKSRVSSCWLANQGYGKQLISVFWLKKPAHQLSELLEPMIPPMRDMSIKFSEGLNRFSPEMYASAFGKVSLAKSIESEKTTNLALALALRTESNAN